ncbi:kinase-like protein [Amniculicola lignicola CBS 123094]|uniref:EKC/KEOPS complex subunit BUD32 n=1 Tax=Amniculicola lignicola CBS 123094 TaxID=1392246 RepID=A0A6A5X1J1_9PLEO|nr:kinase-like protein [Amniculicola lignicola CBS 123094]
MSPPLDPTPVDADADVDVDTDTAPLHTLPPPFNLSALTPLTQGAEALVYTTTFLTSSTHVVLKYRPPKPYRHPTLDKRLTKARLLAEARVLVKCRREGVQVPAVLGGDWEEGWLVLEFVEGGTVRGVLDGWAEGVRIMGGEEKVWALMGRVGRAVGRLHEVGVVHGDLTTSNLMVRGPSPPEGRGGGEHMQRQAQSDPEPDILDGEIVLIDFGLATQSVHEEERAVDLYVLERAFAATHPAAEHLFKEVLRAYGESFKGAKVVLRRLEDVRLRGRKRSMLG